MARLVPPGEGPALSSRALASTVRVIYADTDSMGVVYHGTYLRYLEQGRVEYMRALGLKYADMEREGHGLPVSDVAVTYLASAQYDDVISIWVHVRKLTLARLHFGYELAVEAGDRAGHEERVILAHAETRHACISLADRKVTRLPSRVFDTLNAHLDAVP